MFEPSCEEFKENSRCEHKRFFSLITSKNRFQETILGFVSVWVVSAMFNYFI